MATQVMATAPRSSTFLRIAIALQTLTIFGQAISAGLLLTSSYGETLQTVGARVMYGASMLYVLAAVLAWKPGGGSLRPVRYASGFSCSRRSRSSWASRTSRRSTFPWVC
ncbi:hypothetical protein NLX85_06300 [Micromonospora sp. A3M-1-15]|uniref:hypothetical protein n=1 Tax=Micromonospora sp. A3M-1-15 TaxID=2962035 RepID=UPI0020B81B71|nr:hypothetical protein [Micromonospora sp. A3M-1-15]MCP3782975.1 hypothetical protein [Micromonospora sp. A3M-1-15]